MYYSTFEKEYLICKVDKYLSELEQVDMKALKDFHTSTCYNFAESRRNPYKSIKINIFFQSQLFRNLIQALVIYVVVTIRDIIWSVNVAVQCSDMQC